MICKKVLNLTHKLEAKTSSKSLLSCTPCIFVACLWGQSQYDISCSILIRIAIQAWRPFVHFNKIQLKCESLFWYLIGITGCLQRPYAMTKKVCQMLNIMLKFYFCCSTINIPITKQYQHYLHFYGLYIDKN